MSCSQLDHQILLSPLCKDLFATVENSAKQSREKLT